MSVRAIRDLERGRVEHPRRTSVTLLADALALNGAERAAFENAAASPAGGAERHAEERAVPERMVPRQLPPDIEDFTGRELALEWLYRRVRHRGRGSTALVITAAIGKAGVGKTTLAVHAAHQLSPLFPDGQLYVNLHGAEAQALAPMDALGGFLRALGVEGHSIPDDLGERAGLYRSLMAGRRALVLLDNAADEPQVRPLLPAGPGNLVLVTSRAWLAGLTPAEVIDLDMLPPEQAVELLGKIAGRDRVAGEPEAASVIAALCGYLRRLANRLRAQHRRLDELTAGDMEVRASVALSYQSLGEVERRAFRLLGLLEVPDFAPWMLSALLGISAFEAEEVAERLADAQLLDAAGDDAAGQARYRFHDLLRLYARERLAAEETLAAQLAALERTLQALTQLLADFFEVHACWDEWERTHETALRAARQAGNRHAEASLLSAALALVIGCRDIFRSVRSSGYVAYCDLLIGILCNERGEYDQAADHLQQALTFTNTLGDPRWQGYVLLNLAVTAQACGSHAQARQHLMQSLARFHQSGDQSGISRTRQLIASLNGNRSPLS